MRTAKEMYDYCTEKKFGSGFNKTWGLKHFGVVESNLTSDENVLMCFIGLHNYVSVTQHESNFAYAITNKRVIFGQKKIIGENSKTVYLDQLNDITFKSGLMFGIITIDTIKEKFNVALDKNQAKNINDAIQEVLYSVKNNANKGIEKNDVAEEIRKFKKLLDDGILSQEEFDAKKKQLLSL